MPSVIKGDSNVNLDFSTGGRITGDFSNATFANRVSFQTNTANGVTGVQALPNGTSQTSTFDVYNAADPTNASFGQLQVNASDVRVVSNIRGTGTYLPMTFYTGGSERMRVTTAGDVGIGTSSPVSKLAVDSTTATRLTVSKTANGITDNEELGGLFYRINGGAGTLMANVYYKGDSNATASGTGKLFLGARANNGATTPIDSVCIDSSGNVGIGTSSPSQLLTVGGGSVRGQVNVLGSNGASPTVTLDHTATASGRKYILYSGGSAAGNFDIYDATASAFRATIDSSGNLLVGTTTDLNWTQSATSTGFKAEQNGTIVASRSGFAALLVKRTTASTGNLVEFAYGTSVVGSISTNGTGTTYGTSSDYRLKHDVAPMTGALAKVALLKPVTYKWNADNSDGQGFIAHELAEIVPECVTGEKDAVDTEGNPQYQGIDTSFLVATLTAALQELKAIVDAQGAEIAALKGTA